METEVFKVLRLTLWKVGGLVQSKAFRSYSGPVGEVVHLLAHLFKGGYMYRSLNAYRSVISSVHEKVDRYEVGQHPLVSRVLKGAFNQRPPEPRYKATWDISRVLNYIESLGRSDSLPQETLRAYEQKTALPNRGRRGTNKTVPSSGKTTQTSVHLNLSQMAKDFTR